MVAAVLEDEDVPAAAAADARALLEKKFDEFAMARLCCRGRCRTGGVSLVMPIVMLDEVGIMISANQFTVRV